MTGELPHHSVATAHVARDNRSPRRTPVDHRPDPSSASCRLGFAGGGHALTGWGKGDWAGLADITGDGKADLAIHNPLNNTVAVAVNNGTGQLTAPGTGTWLTTWGSTDWTGLADITGDAKADLVVHRPDNTWAIALSTGNSFTGGGTALAGWGLGNGWAALTDVTGDQRADIVVPNTTNNTYAVAVNNGTGTFNAPTTGTWLTGWAPETGSV